ncbi:MAG: hypothetical protein RL757_1739 [Bacteroidota bacterium]|jgi:hypothetical protein
MTNYNLSPTLEAKATLIDVFDLFNNVYPDVTRFLDSFFSSSPNWKTDIHAEVRNTELMRHFYFESRNRQRTRGEQPFGVGFLFLVDRTKNGEIFCQPIFIWHLSLLPHPTRPDSWFVSFNERSPIVINELVLEHLSEKHGQDFRPMLEKFLQRKDFSLKTFDALSRKMADKFKFTNENVNSGLKSVPKKELLSELSLMGDISWSAAIGLFPHIYASKKGSDTGGGANFKNQPLNTEKIHKFSALESDDAQYEALRSSLENRLTLVQAAHGGGKTRTATNLILHALSNGQKMAIVANDMATLVEIQAKLVELGFGNHTFLLKDLYHDKNLLLQTIKNEGKLKHESTFENEAFRVNLNQARRWQQRLDDQQDALVRPIFGDENWENIVGKYNAANQQIGKELLANHLKSDDFVFDTAEYAQLSAQISAAYTSFQNIKTLRHPLGALRPDLFVEKTAAESRAFVSEELAHFSTEIGNLQHDYIKTIERYTQKLSDHYDSHFHDLSNHVQKMRESMADYTFQYGDDFENASGGWLAIASPFSERASGISKAKENLLTHYESLKNAYNSREYRYFEHKFLKISEAKDVKKLKQNLTDFDFALQSCRMRLTSMVNEQTQRLSSKTAQHFDAKIAEKAAKIEKKLDETLQTFNQTGLFAQPFQHKMLTLQKRLQYVEELKAHLEEMDTQMRDFDTFHDWQRMWLGFDKKTQQLLAALVRVKPQNWQTAFDSWYFYHILMFNYDVDVPRDNEHAEKANEHQQIIRQAMLPQIADLWSRRKVNATKALNFLDKPTFNWFFDSKQKHESDDKTLLQILENGLNPLTEFFPVLLMPPPVYRAILSLETAENKVFNVTIFENAQHLDASLGNLTHRNDRNIALAERSVFDNPNADNLVTWFRKQGAKEVNLNHIYKSSIAPLAAFQHNLFYPDMILEGESPAYLLDFLKIINVKSGEYEPSRRENRAEILEIVAAVAQIEANPTTRLYPKIGIVTFTTEQRNRIGSHFLQIVQKKMTDSDKIERLQNNGNLAIFDISELDGQRFDILIVGGTFSQAEHALDLKSTDLRLLLNAFSQQLVWINSMSDMTLQFISDNETYNSPLHLLASSLLFLQNISKAKDRTDIEGIDEAFFSNIQSLRADYWQPRNVEASQFAVQLAAALAHEGIAETDVVLNEKILQNIKAPVVVHYEDEKNQIQKIALRFDGRFGNNKFFNAEREVAIGKQLKEKNIEFIDVWTYDFWKNPSRAARKIAKKIAEITTPPVSEPVEAVMEAAHETPQADVQHNAS